MNHDPNDILTLAEAAAWLRVDARVLKRYWFEWGGWKIGQCYRVSRAKLEEGLNADKEKRQEWPMAGQGLHRGPDGGLKDVSPRKKRRPRVAGGQDVGGRTATSHIGKPGAPFDLKSVR